MWGQQRATLQSPGPAGEYASSYKVREGYLGIRDEGQDKTQVEATQRLSSKDG